MLGVGEATRERDGQSCLRIRPLGIEPCLRLPPGACIEFHTEVGGVLVHTSTLGVGVVERLGYDEVGVAERLGYDEFGRESGRGGDETVEAATFLVVARNVPVLALACSCATRASSTATWSRNLFSRS